MAEQEMEPAFCDTVATIAGPDRIVFMCRDMLAYQVSRPESKGISPDRRAVLPFIHPTVRPSNRPSVPTDLSSCHPTVLPSYHPYVAPSFRRAVLPFMQIAPTRFPL